MLAKELINKLSEYENFEIKISIWEDNKGMWPNLKTYFISGIGDISYSDKIIILDIKEE